MANISLKNLSKVYPSGIKAVTDFSLEINDGEFIVLVGPSGCGKSTVLRMIAGLENVSSGQIKIDDLVVNNLPPGKRKVAMVFQNFALFPNMTVFENMAFGLKVAKEKKEEINKKVHEAAILLNLKDELNRFPNTLSGGQRQRVALGRAILSSPKVFLLDEPLSNLDAKMRSSMRSELINLHEKLNATFIYVTHDQIEAMTMGSRIVVMNEGKIQQIGTPTEIYNNPANMFVAGFIGNPPMNFFNVSIKKDNTKIFLDICGNLLPIENKFFDKSFINYNNFTLGIRAEDIYLAKDIENKENYFILSSIVNHIEDLGGEKLIYALINNCNPIVMRVKDISEIKRFQLITIALDKTKIKYFDTKTKLTLS